MNKNILPFLLSLFLLSGCTKTDNPPVKPEEESHEEKQQEEHEEEEEEDNPPAPPAPVNKFFLPSKCIETIDNYKYETSYVYDEDLHGYVETEINNLDSEPYSKEVRTYKFNEDFSKYNMQHVEYDFKDGEFKETRNRKFEYEYLPNLGFIQKDYEYDYENEEFVFAHETSKQYNKRGQILLQYLKKEDDSGVAYFDNYIEYEYDENGYQTSYILYEDWDGVSDKNSFITAYDDYKYNQDMTKCKIQSYYKFDETLEKDGYVMVTITHEDNLLKFNQQNYDEEGTPGNNNDTHYTSDFYPVYVRYGGLGEESSIELNENNQIIKYTYTDGETVENDGFQYENGLLTSSSYSSGNTVNHTDSTSVFTYSESSQILTATREYESYAVDAPEETERSTNAVRVEYSTLQCDSLHEKLDYVENITRAFAHYILNKDERLI